MSEMHSEQGAPHGLSTRIDAGVLTLSFARGDLNPELGRILLAELQAVAANELVRVVVLCSAAGGLRGSIAPGICGDLVRQLRALPQPVIAKLRGAWHGSVLALVAACDIVYAADDAEFQLDEANNGTFISGPVGQALSSVMTRRSVSQHALDGRPFNGIEAERNGLATLSFAPADLDGETDTLLASLLEKDPLALQFTKQTLRHVPTMGWDAVLDYNAAKFAELKSIQAGKPSARAAAVESFLAGTSKPGLGS
ncbi:enoyl-CoA hydratase-related protein [Bradyrhizobium sp. SYSU BS000235]|uniref:enoyl-CoA hydratase-related protein n=1 Tax=Bradyrhizobium sp. SYSU BS000235 TaxID=3411332 RepID=UPI003C711D10